MQTFDEYWLAYLAGHSRTTTRILHYLGLFFAPLAGLVASVFIVWWAFFVVAPVFYIIAYFTHRSSSTTATSLTPTAHYGARLPSCGFLPSTSPGNSGAR